ncbi:MAG: cytochrome c [Acidobacteria bacterium]|nr:cytochrome c [Acidobacteriota bacterium]
MTRCSCITSPQPGNNPTGASFLSSFRRDLPTRGRVPFTRLSVHTLVRGRLDFTGRFIYTSATTRFNLFETVTGAPLHEAGDLYKAKCASCHGADGRGNTSIGKRMKLRDLRSPDVQKMSDDQLFDIIAKGRGKMPGYIKSLDHDKIHKIVSYIRELGGRKR